MKSSSYLCLPQRLCHWQSGIDIFHVGSNSLQIPWTQRILLQVTKTPQSNTTIHSTGEDQDILLPIMKQTTAEHIGRQGEQLLPSHDARQHTGGIFWGEGMATCTHIWVTALRWANKRLWVLALFGEAASTTVQVSVPSSHPHSTHRADPSPEGSTTAQECT